MRNKSIMKNMKKELKNYVLSLGIEKSIQSKFMKLLMLMVLKVSLYLNSKKDLRK